MGGIEGAVMGLLGSLVGNAFYNSLLHQCKVDEDFSGDLLTYKGNRYDREKFVSLRADDLKDTKPNALKKMLSAQQKNMQKAKYPDIEKAELDAIDLALKIQDNPVLGMPKTVVMPDGTILQREDSSEEAEE